MAVGNTSICRPLNPAQAPGPEESVPSPDNEARDKRKRDLARTNVLIATGPGELGDTVRTVNAVLKFMSERFLEASESEEGMTIEPEAAWGAQLILDNCRIALSFHLDDQDGEEEPSQEDEQ